MDRMPHAKRRRILLAAGALIAAPAVGRAQSPGKLPVLGILDMGPAPTPDQIAASPLLNRLRELGWRNGETLKIERENSAWDFARLPELARALVEKKPDVIWTSAPEGAVAAAQATRTIPIVFWRVGFPVEFGLVDSLARPGRNVTGLAWFADERIYVKRYQLLRELLPKARRVAQIGTPQAEARTVSGEVVKIELREMIEAVLPKLGFELLRTEMSGPADFARVAAEIEKWGADCLNVLDRPATVSARAQIVGFARRKQLPAMYEAQEWTRAGGLISYGIEFLPTLLRTADMVDMILRGAKPAAIPVELPRDHQLTVNRKTAKELGIQFPQSILVLANPVIE